VASFFFDSSALFKGYVTEKGSDWIRPLFEPAQRHRLFVIRVAHVELASALARRVQEGALTASSQTSALTLFEYHLAHRFGVIEIDADLCRHAALLAQSRALRAYDSLQLAGALKANSALQISSALGLVFLSSDVRLLNTAAAEELTVSNPEDH